MDIQKNGLNFFKVKLLDYSRRCVYPPKMLFDAKKKGF